MYRSTGIRAPCMSDCQGTQTFFSRWNAKSQVRSLVCTLLNLSNIAITSVVCILRNSNDNSNYALCSRVKTVRCNSCHTHTQKENYVCKHIFIANLKVNPAHIFKIQVFMETYNVSIYYMSMCCFNC